MGKDWIEWHHGYDDPQSSLSRRLAVVQDFLRRALSAAPGDGGHELRLISLCAGDGRDVLPVLAAHEAGARCRAVLVELDRELAGRATASAAAFGLSSVTVRAADAGDTAACADLAPAHIVLACGVFGNIPAEHIRRTISVLPGLLTPAGFVIWTRGRGDGDDPAGEVREWFAGEGFAEVGFAAPSDAGFRVGMHQLARVPAPPPPPGTRMFAFT